MFATVGATPSIGIVRSLGLPATLLSVDRPRPFGFSAMPSSSALVLRYRRGAEICWSPRPNSSVRRLYSTPSLGLNTEYRSIGASRPPTSFQFVILPK